jgi:GntR family transcriptional regulator of arabinose operon
MSEITPKYVWLKQIIVDAARTEGWSEGHRLPSENELAETYAVSRSTVRQTLEELEREGLLSRQRGRGTFYTPNTSGKAGRNYLIGITTALSGYIYPAIVRGAEEVFSERGYHSLFGPNLLVEELRRSADRESPPWRLDGLLFEPSVSDRVAGMQRAIERVQGFGIPFVMLNWITDDPNVSWVAPDDVKAGETIAQYLLERGHRRIAFVGIRSHQPALNRLAGFRSRLAEDGLLPREDQIILVEQNEDRYVNTYRRTKELLETHRPLPTAFFFYNDQSAAEGYHAIKDVGLSIPDEVSVVSYDDSELGRALNPRLTTMEHPKEELGRWAARLLLDQIERPTGRFALQVKMESTIVERASVRSLSV